MPLEKENDYGLLDNGFCWFDIRLVDAIHFGKTLVAVFSTIQGRKISILGGGGLHCYK